MTMNLFNKDLKGDVIVVAEVGVNHEGDPEKARTLLRLAAEAGADAVKFQAYTPARFIASDDAERLERVSRFALSDDDFRALAQDAKELGVAFFASAISEDQVPFLAELGEAIKIASGDIDFEPVIRAAAQSGRVVILSTGTATIDEVDRAVAWVRDEVGDAALAQRLVILHCVSAYPTPLAEANLMSIPYMKERYAPVPVGYSNHVIGPEAAIAAVALGARMIEVHFTDCKDGRAFRDHALSADPDDLRYLVSTLPDVAKARGVCEKRPQPCETGMASAIRKGVVAARNLPEGTVLSRQDLMFARPATEFPAGQVQDLVGRTLKRALSAGAVVRRDDVAADE